VFDAVAAVIADTGALRGHHKRWVDSTVFDDVAATQDTLTQLVAAMRKVVRCVPGAQSVIERVTRLDYSKPGKPDIDWDDPAAKGNLVSDLVNDAVAVLAELTGGNAPHRDEPAADALGLLALVAGRHVVPAEGSEGTDGRWRIARRVAPDRAISTVNIQTRHTRKSKSVRRDDYRGHIAAEPKTGLITDAEVTKAAGETGTDAVVGQAMIARDRYHRGGGAAPVAAPAADGPRDARRDTAHHAVVQPDCASGPATGAPIVGGVVAAVATTATGAGQGLQGIRRFGIWHRCSTRGLCGRRARHGDQTHAAEPRGAGRVHPR